MGRYAEEPSGIFSWLDVVKIAIGVFVGSLLAVFAYEQILAVRVEIAAREASSYLQKQSAQAAAAAERARTLRDEEREERARNDRERAEAQRAIADAARLREERRRLAWSRYFQPSEACRADPGTLPCANAHMAAKKRFDAEYVDR